MKCKCWYWLHCVHVYLCRWASTTSTRWWPCGGWWTCGAAVRSLSLALISAPSESAKPGASQEDVNIHNWEFRDFPKYSPTTLLRLWNWLPTPLQSLPSSGCRKWISENKSSGWISKIFGEVNNNIDQWKQYWKLPIDQICCQYCPICCVKSAKLF